jgi:CRP/FNR family cyclic AMP-dependent transcriptional regulator
MTDHSEMRAALATHPFVSDLAPRLLDELAALAHVAEFRAGAWIAQNGHPVDSFHLLTEGRCAVEVTAAGRAPLVIATVHAGEVLGWSWMVPPHSWHFDVLALDPTRTIAIDGTALRMACNNDHELGYEITRRLAGVIAGRLDATRMQLMDMYGTQA